MGLISHLSDAYHVFILLASFFFALESDEDVSDKSDNEVSGFGSTSGSCVSSFFELSVDCVIPLLSNQVTASVGSVPLNIFRVPSFPLKNFSSFKFRILNMIKVRCCFSHSFKIMHVPQPIITFRVPPQTVQALSFGGGGEIDVPCIRCLNGQVPESYELWAVAEGGFREVYLYDRVELLSDFREDTFHTHFFNA